MHFAMNLALLIIAHLIGDFLLQNHWMQAKSKDTFICAIHVIAYSLPFVALVLLGLCPDWVFTAILIQHFLQDRFALHLKWMRVFQQTTPAMWPVGPLCVDQAWHVAFIGLFYLIASP
jgi:hypothetical protein